ncbi:MAG: hypothetical protein V1928_05425 [Parcubacteria group bacterium]
MQQEKWEELLEKVRKNFGIEEQTTEPIDDIPRAFREIVVCNSPMGKLKLIRTTKPKVLDRKTIYSNRPGAQMNVRYEYSETEFTNNLEILKWDENREMWGKAEIGF